MDFHSVPGKIHDSLWLPLYIHLHDTAEVMSFLYSEQLSRQEKQNIGLPESQGNRLCYFLGYVHDIGKATPGMQKRFSDSIYFSHSLAGEAVLLSYSCPKAIAAIVGSHHGKPQKKGCNIMQQMEKEPSNYYGKSEEEKKEWEEIRKRLFEEALREAGFHDVSELPQNLSLEAQMNLSGLLSKADWIATEYFPLISVLDNGDGIDLSERARKVLHTYPASLEDEMDLLLAGRHLRFSRSGINFTKPWVPCTAHTFTEEFGFEPNHMQQAVIEIANNSTKPGLFFIESAMGSGKTEAALKASEYIAQKNGSGGLAFFLPTIATTDSMFSRLTSWARIQSGREFHTFNLVHSNADLNQDYKELKNNEDCLVVSDIFKDPREAMCSEFILGTTDQLLMAFQKQKYITIVQQSLIGKTLIIDEVHSYDAYMSQYLEKALRWCGSYGIPVILLSATLTDQKREELIKAYTGKKSVGQLMSGNEMITWVDVDGLHQKVLSDTHGNRVVNIKTSDGSDIISLLKEALAGGGNAGIVCNTVSKAQNTAKELKAQFPDYTIICDHSRFTNKDRAEKEQVIMSRLGTMSTPKQRDKVIVVGTQVLEQSLDIDFDFMITDLCPMDLLLQRIGRLHRRSTRWSRTGVGTPATCVVLTKSFGRIYAEWIVSRTLKYLPESIHLPDDIGFLVNSVYAEPSDEELNNEELRRQWWNYKESIKKEREKADAYCLRDPDAGNTIHGLLDITVKHSEAKVRDFGNGMEKCYKVHRDGTIEEVDKKDVKTSDAIVHVMDYTGGGTEHKCWYDKDLGFVKSDDMKLQGA